VTEMWKVILDKMNYQQQKIMPCGNRDWEQSEFGGNQNVKKMQNSDGRLCYFKTGFMYVMYDMIWFVSLTENRVCTKLGKGIC